MYDSPTASSPSHCSRSRYVSTNQVRVRKGFRYARRVQAFEHVAYNEVPIPPLSLSLDQHQTASSS